jgi:phage FluMu gp28-like protein
VPTRLPSTHAADAPPPVLLDYQQAWIADDSQLKVSEKSRRTGLTWAEAADDVLIAAAAKNAGGMNVYYIGYNQDMAIEYVEACGMWARVFNHAASAVEEGIWEDDGDDKHIKTFTIKFPDSGHRIVALSSRPANLRGKQGVVVIDEAAFHDKLGELLKAALALLIWGGKVRVISTHNGEQNPFNQLINDIRAGRRKGSVQRITFTGASACAWASPGARRPRRPGWPRCTTSTARRPARSWTPSPPRGPATGCPGR